MTKHLDSLQIKNFRMLEDFTVERLGQVNLIVGKNNSGKSTVLEALQVYAGNADIELLEKIAKRHGEKFCFTDDEVGNPKAVIYFKDFFSKNKLEKYGFFSIGEKNKKTLSFIYANTQSSSFYQMDESARALYKVTQEQWKIRKLIRSFIIIKEDFRYTYLIDDPRLDIITTGHAENIPYALIPTQLASLDELSVFWDDIVFTEASDFVDQALLIIEPRYLGLSFIKDKNKSTNQRTAIVRLNDQEQPISLKSLGDGVQRILQIALNIYAAKDGFLLIDEFENGLHYSVQEKVWGLIFEMAQRLNIQVFATTHSRDCIEAFSKVANDRVDVEGLLFRMGRSAKASDEGKIIATIFDEARLDRMTQSDMEIR